MIRGRPAEQAAAFRGDWVIGGDLAKFDDDGWVWHQGPNDDIMNAFGYRVSPLEVEKVLAAKIPTSPTSPSPSGRSPRTSP